MSLSSLRCPGQNPMFWKPDDIYNVACPGCGKPVEFWKDDAKRTCACGHRFSNPKRDLGCLEYCRYAEACMPEMFRGENLQAHYRDRLIARMRSSLNPDTASLERIAQAADLAEQVLADEGGEPKVVIAATIILSLLASQAQDDRSAPTAGVLDRGEACALLAELGTEPEVVEQICNIAWRRSGEAVSDVNLRVVQDALTLQELLVKKARLDRSEWEQLAAVEFQTETGARLASKHVAGS